jgi:hypothetical protein
MASADVGYFDDDRDHRVSRKEFIEKPSPFFTRYDANGDCRVTAEEMKGPSTPRKSEVAPAREEEWACRAGEDFRDVVELAEMLIAFRLGGAFELLEIHRELLCPNPV